MAAKPTLFERLTRRAVKKEQAAVSTLADLTTAVLDGKDVDEDSAAAVLEASGKSAEDLQAAVELLQQRRQWAKAAKQAPGAQARLAEIAARFEAIAAETIEQRTRLCAEERALGIERNALLAAVAAADQARAELHKTAPSSGKLKSRKLTASKLVLIGQRRDLLRELSLPDHATEANTSGDLLSLRHSRLNLLRHQKAEDGQGKHKLLGDRRPLADELAEVESEIVAEGARPARVWQDIKSLDKQIESLDAAGHEISESELAVA
jgi:hypothetical protein